MDFRVGVEVGDDLMIVLLLLFVFSKTGEKENGKRKELVNFCFSFLCWVGSLVFFFSSLDKVLQKKTRAKTKRESTQEKQAPLDKNH